MRTRQSTALIIAAALATSLGAGFAATVDDVFQQPRDNLSLAELEAFRRGHEIFHAAWKPPGTAPEFTGLGPMFNTDSCASCHVKNGRGPAPRVGDTGITLVVTKFAAEDSGKGEQTLRRYGNRLNYKAIAGVPAEGELTVAEERIEGRFADGQPYILHKPKFDFAKLSNGAVEPDTIVAVRMAPPLAGLGLLAQIPDDWISARAAANEKREGPVKGKANVVWDQVNFRMALGRFGWKADQPNLTRIIAAAFITDMGLTSRLFPQENCGDQQPACKAVAVDHPPEVDDQTLSAVTQYVALLKPPAPRFDAEGERGRAIFEGTGCASCHVPRVPVVNADNTTSEIAPYTDMLLHDMGDGLADGMKEAAATGCEWRTAPLWGLGQARLLSDRPGYLHDGRAFTVPEAILWHGGEAQAARDGFTKLDAASRAALLKFLDQL